MSNCLLKVEQLSKSFGQRKVVDGVTFVLEHGRTLGLLGPNGAGKSTTVNMICGLLRADQGRVVLDGQVMGAGNNQAKMKLGLVPQDLALFEDLSARENLKLFGALYGLSGAKLALRCDAVLDLVSLSDRAKDKATTFSGGMKRRLNIAAAMLHDPTLLILDEPTVGVDPQSRNAIFDALEILKAQGRSLIYTSHYMEEVERLADHIVIIDQGKVIANETPTALFQRLPSHAALEVHFEHAIDLTGLDLLGQQTGVTKIETHDSCRQLQIALSTQEFALPVLNYLTQQGLVIQHFSTAKTKLEDVFLTLTGRSLRD
ncbi:MAG: ABC transporter ATP-binding protein [Undibacterium sp.]|nr:ABC transporter ATP-binding protein [Undibacterium sp.]